MPVDSGLSGTGRPRPPTIFRLDGKVYYTRAAYDAAVAAKARAQVLAQQQAQAAAQQQRDLQRQAGLARAARPAAAATAVTSDAAARAALAAAEATRLAQEQARLQAQREFQLRRQAALRRLEIQRLVAAGRTRQAQLLVDRQASEQRELQRKATEERAALARRRAYDALQQANVRADAVLRGVRDLEAQRGRQQKTRATQLERAGAHWAASIGGLTQGVNDTRGTRYVKAVDKKRAEAITRGETTGDWSDAIEIVNRQSLESGGRYVDTDMLRQIEEGYVVPVIEIGQKYEEAIRQAQTLFEAEDMDGLRKLIESEDFVALEAQFTEYFGDGRTPGSFAEHAQVLTEIAARRERLWMGLMLDPSGNTTSQQQIDQLIERAQHASRVDVHRGGLQEGADFASQRDLTFRDRVFDPATGKYREEVRTGLDAYLAREAARQQDAQREAFAQQTQHLRNIRGTGRYKTGRPTSAQIVDDRLVTSDIRQKRVIEEAQRLVRDGAIRIDDIIKAPNEAVREELIRNFLRDAESAYRESHAAQFQAEKLGQRGLGPEANVSYQQNMTAWMTELMRALRGSGAGDYGFGQQFDQSIGAGDIFRAIQLPLATGMSWMREQRANLFGDYNRPSIGLNFGFGGLNADGTPKPLGIGLNISTEVDPNGRKAYEEFVAGMMSPDANVRANAQRAYGQGYLGGNLGWLVEGLGDPLNVVAPGAWLNRARLATAAIGGARELASVGGIGRALESYVRYSSPEFLGGLGRSRLRTDLARLTLARELNVPASQVLHMSDDDLRSLLADAARGREALEASTAFERLFERSGIDRDQLLNLVQERLPAISREYGLLPVDPFEMQARIRAAREGFARAEQQAREAVQLEQRRIAAEEAAQALEAARLKAGVSVGQAVTVTATSIAKHERLLAKYIGTAQDYLAVAKRANKAAEQLDAIGQMAVPDHRRLQTVYSQLKTALGDMAKYEDDYQIRNGVKELHRPGLVSEHYRDLAEYRMAIGGDPKMPSFAQLSQARIRADRRLITSRIRGLQRALASAKTQADIASIKAELTEAHKARVGVEIESAMLDRGRAVARTYGRRHLDRVEKAVRPQRLARKAVNEEQRAVEVSRDLSNRLGSIEKIDDAPQLSAEAEALQRHSRQELAGRSGSDLADWIRGVLQRKPGAKFGNLPAGEVLQQLEDLAKALDVDLAELSLEDLLLALHRVWTNAVDRSKWTPLWRLVRGRADAVLRRVGWNGDDVVGAFIDQLSWEHVRAGKVIGLEGFEKVDKSVADALFDLRKFRAEGQVRGGTKRYGQDSLRDLLRPDSDPAWVLTKMRALREHGMDLFEYDRARGVLRDVMLRKNTMAGLLDEARELVRTAGLTMDEAWDKVLKARSQKESLREFEEFATRLENQGRAPEQVLRLFEERYVGRDLGQAPGLQMTTYQDAVLRQAWRETTGFDYSDEHLRRHWLSGMPRELPKGARRMRSGEFLLPDGADVDLIFVVPADHPKLIEDVPFGRPREIPDDLEWSGSRTEPVGLDYAGRRAVSESADGGAPLTTRRLFDGPANATEREYERFVWNDMQRSSHFRSRLWELGDPKHRAGLEEKYGMERSGVLLRASTWLRSPEGRRFFRKRAAQGYTHHSAYAVSRAQWAEDIQAELGTLQEGLREMRKLAGQEFQVRPERSWVAQVALGLIQKRNIQGYFHSTGDRKAIAALLLGDDEHQGLLRLLGIDRSASWDEAVDLVKRAAKEKGVTEWVSVARLAQFREALQRLDELGELGIARIDELLSGDLLPKRWELVKGAGDDPGGRWLRRVEQTEARIRELRDELKAGFPAQRDEFYRRRGTVGLSVARDGIYISESASNVTLAHEVFHQFWDDADNAQWVGEISQGIDRLGPTVRDELWRRMRVGAAVYDESEFAAELFALWRVGQDTGSDVLFSWADLRALLAASQDPGLANGVAMLDALGEVFQGYSPKMGASLIPPHAPPLWNRSKMRKWLVENGYWSPRTGEQIASGERVWSIADERTFFEKNWGYTPPWTDPEVLAPLLSDQRSLQAAFDQWGFFEGGFEEVVGGLKLSPDEQIGAVVWGREGLAGKRSLAEMRHWVVERYGSLVGSFDDEGLARLERMPWLMRADDEYLSWMENALSDAGRAAREAEWRAARPGLPPVIDQAVFDGDDITRFGIEINRGLVKPKEMDKLSQAIVRATRRRLERLTKAGDVDPGDWLPQEQLRFAYDVANELLADPVWRGLLRGTPVIGAALHLWSQFWRLLVSFQPAFPIMNLIETFGTRRLLLAVFENGFRPLSLDAEGARLVRTLREIGADSSSLFYMAEGGDPWLRVGDKMLSLNIRGGATIRGVIELPLKASKFGEDRLRLDFARSVAGNTYRAAIKTGMEESVAASLARFEARRVVATFFVVGDNRSWLRGLNELVPFFSYNYNNKRLALKMLWEHPSLVAWADRIGREVKQANRDAWEKEYPGVPFPEDDPSSSWLWLKIGDDFYTVDLSNFSDWTRAMKNVTASQNAFDWFNEFVRVPHPSQVALFAWITGGVTPWGKPGNLRELSAWADLWMWLNGQDYDKPGWQRNQIQMLSQLLFFKRFGRITPIKAKLQQYFAFRDLDPAQARTYLEQNPDLQSYFDQLAGRERAPIGDRRVHWYTLLNDQERAEYDSAIVDWKALNEQLDKEIFRYANEPWSAEYRDARKRAFVARTQFLHDHPILPDSWGVYMTAQEFAELQDNWKLDELSDAWFGWERPQRDAFKNEIAYQKALVDYYDQRTAFLEANPALAARLFEGRNAIENAWREQELHWSEILEFQAKLKLRILEEQEKPDADRELVDLLYEVRDAASLELDAERYTQVFGVVVPGNFDQGVAQRLIDALSSPGKGLIRRVAQLPGFADFIYGRATPEERAQIERNEWYAKGIAEVMSKATDGKSFYDQLFKNPALLQEYWRRNPDARARYEAGREYFRWISSWVSKLKGDDFVGAQAVWDSMPAWVRERYLAKHPESGMADGVMGGSFRSPESRARFVRGQEYYAAMGRWVELLKAKDYGAADRYFRNLPAWMREKYYAKHPDQRAQNELESEVLRKGAEYFLATGDDKLAILQKYPELRAFLAEHGGDEGAFRGLIMAMYRAIPSSEAWLKRTFRQQFPEIFSQESQGERRLASVARDLAKHPEMLPFYERALALQSRLFIDQLKRSKVPPQPWEMERKKRLRKRSKRRAARMHSHWTLHRDLRRHPGE